MCVASTRVENVRKAFLVGVWNIDFPQTEDCYPKFLVAQNYDCDIPLLFYSQNKSVSIEENNSMNAFIEVENQKRLLQYYN